VRATATVLLTAPSRNVTSGDARQDAPGDTHATRVPQKPPLGVGGARSVPEATHAIAASSVTGAGRANRGEATVRNCRRPPIISELPVLRRVTGEGLGGPCRCRGSGEVWLVSGRAGRAVAGWLGRQAGRLCCSLPELSLPVVPGSGLRVPGRAGAPGSRAAFSAARMRMAGDRSPGSRSGSRACLAVP
jgi:hypothetical protein